MTSSEIIYYFFYVTYVLVDVIAICGCLLVFFGCWKSRDSINLALKLIFFLSIFDFIISVENLGQDVFISNDLTCKVHSFIRLYASYLSLTWTFSMSLIAFLIMRNFRRNVTRMFVSVLLGSFIVSLLFAMRPFLGFSSYYYKYIESDDPEDPDGYCDTVLNPGVSDQDAILKFCFEQILPYSLGILITLVAYFRGHSYFGRRPSNEFALITLSEGLKLIRYPFIQLLIYTPGMLSSLFILMASNFNFSLLVLMLKNLYSLSGFITYLLYRKQFQRPPIKTEIPEISMQMHNTSAGEEEDL